MADTYYTEFGIYSRSLTPEQIDEFIGITCDRGYHVGDRRKPTIILEKDNGWLLYSQISRDNLLECHVRSLLERLKPFTEKIRQLANKPDVEVEFGCVVFTSRRPILHFAKEQVEAIQHLGASVDIDLYWLPEDDDEDESNSSNGT